MAGLSRPKLPWMRRPFFKFGLPFLVTVVGGSFWLKDFTQLRYTFRKQKQITRAEMEKLLGVSMKKEKFDPEKELELMQKDVETDYVMLRGPRPYEETGEQGYALLATLKARRMEERARKKALREAAEVAKVANSSAV